MLGLMDRPDQITAADLDIIKFEVGKLVNRFVCASVKPDSSLIMNLT